MSRILSADQIDRFGTDGILLPLGPAYDRDEIDSIRIGISDLMELLEPGETTKEIREWHESSRFLFDICMNEKILDYVEDLIGPDFFLWASNFFIKEPRTVETVAWHQDAFYWPMEPAESVTVWLAIDDVDESNGAMVVIPGTHQRGMVDHERLDENSDSVLGLGIDPANLNDSRGVSVNLPAGWFSIHDDKLVHGSPANSSDRRRAGFTIRYSPSRVKNDMSVNSNFLAYLCRGQDKYHHNPEGQIPTKRMGRLHREYESKDEQGTDEERVGLKPS